MKREGHFFHDEKPEKSVERFRDIIEYVVRKYNDPYYLHPFSADDLRQHIYLNLLENIERVKAIYRGEARVRTYMSAVIRNYALGFIRSRRSDRPEAIDTDKQATPFAGQQQVVAGMEISIEIKRLTQILILFGKKKGKVELVLKGYFGRVLTREDVEKYLSKLINEKFLMAFIERVNSRSGNTDGEIFEIYTDFFNEVEGKQNTVDAMRKWTLRVIDELIQKLNNTHEKRTHNKESLGILLNFYFEPREKKVIEL